MVIGRSLVRFRYVSADVGRLSTRVNEMPRADFLDAFEEA